jgi:hypothetical protein
MGVGAAAFIPAEKARADGDAEGWVWVETRTPLARDRGGRAWLQLRSFADLRLATATSGIDNVFLRLGPIIDVAPWLFVGLHATAQADQTGVRGYDQEFRAELEPNFRFRFGDFAFNDRNRAEYRHRTKADGATRESLRYRNQLRISYAPEGQWWLPFLWDELLVDSIDGVHQNRLAAGLGFVVAPRTRLDVGYMLQSRAASDAWEHDHVALLYLFVDVPDAAP